MFLTYISKNFDDGPVSFETFYWSYLRSGFVSKISYQFRSFFYFGRFVFFKTGRKGNGDYFISKFY